MNTAQQSIKAEFKKRTDLIKQKEFRVKCAQIAEEMGMSADEWNKNKAKILLWMANKVISQAEEAMA